MEGWGRTRLGVPIKRFILRPKLSTNFANGPHAEVWTKVRAAILSYGAAVQQLWIPGFTDTKGSKRANPVVADVVLGYPDIGSYEKNPAYHGVVVGRVAGRINNGKFTIPSELDPANTTVYSLPKNQQNKHCLHGGL